MKILVAALALGLALPAFAEDESFPISGSLSTGVSFNHGNFTDLGGVEGGAGYVRGSLSGSVGYTLPVEGLSASASFSLTKPLEENFVRASGATQPGKTEISDIGLGLGYDIATLGPVNLGSSLDLVVPLSNASRAAGLITNISPGLSASVKLPAGFSLSAGAGLSYNVNEDATQQLDCDEFRDLCDQLGGAGGLGQPNSLWGFSANGGLGWKAPLPGLSLRAGYSWGTGLSAVEFKKDEFTSEFAQTGAQLQGDSHGTSFGISYTPSPMVEVPEGEKAPAPEGAWAALGHFTLSLSMSTRQSFYSSDGSRVTVPIFDFETGTQQRTVYGISLSANL
ncbi:MAG: hypothetical protein KC549_12865 [Myxococcales bacterium]|nr:hypothetical protein [Myxococcales bacterium]MCB9546114.1 hypothetical protein [Myxococcales bacterium]